MCKNGEDKYMLEVIENLRTRHNVELEEFKKKLSSNPIDKALLKRGAKIVNSLMSDIDDLLYEYYIEGTQLPDVIKTFNAMLPRIHEARALYYSL